MDMDAMFLNYVGISVFSHRSLEIKPCPHPTYLLYNSRLSKLVKIAHIALVYVDT